MCGTAGESRSLRRHAGGLEVFFRNDHSHIRRLGNIGLLTALLVGCGDSPVEVVEVPEPIDLSGVWDFTEVLLRSTIVPSSLS